jgi:hypothetical protein
MKKHGSTARLKCIGLNSTLRAGLPRLHVDGHSAVFNFAHGSVVMKREALGVGGVVGPLLEKREKWGTPRLYYSAVKNERRHYRDAGEDGHPPTRVNE